MVRIHPDPPGSAVSRQRSAFGNDAAYGVAESRVLKAEVEGAVAQLGEHLLCKQGVVGSIPSSSTSPV